MSISFTPQEALEKIEKITFGKEAPEKNDWIALIASRLNAENREPTPVAYSFDDGKILPVTAEKVPEILTRLFQKALEHPNLTQEEITGLFEKISSTEKILESDLDTLKALTLKRFATLSETNEELDKLSDTLYTMCHKAILKTGSKTFQAIQTIAKAILDKPREFNLCNANQDFLTELGDATTAEGMAQAALKRGHLEEHEQIFANLSEKSPPKQKAASTKVNKLGVAALLFAAIGGVAAGAAYAFAPRAAAEPEAPLSPIDALRQKDLTLYPGAISKYMGSQIDLTPHCKEVAQFLSDKLPESPVKTILLEAHIMTCVPPQEEYHRFRDIENDMTKSQEMRAQLMKVVTDPDMAEDRRETAKKLIEAIDFRIEKLNEAAAIFTQKVNQTLLPKIEQFVSENPENGTYIDEDTQTWSMLSNTTPEALIALQAQYKTSQENAEARLNKIEEFCENKALGASQGMFNMTKISVLQNITKEKAFSHALMQDIIEDQKASLELEEILNDIELAKATTPKSPSSFLNERAKKLKDFSDKHASLFAIEEKQHIEEQIEEKQQQLNKGDLSEEERISIEHSIKTLEKKMDHRSKLASQFSQTEKALSDFSDSVQPERAVKKLISALDKKCEEVDGLLNEWQQSTGESSPEATSLPKKPKAQETPLETATSFELPTIDTLQGKVSSIKQLIEKIEANNPIVQQKIAELNKAIQTYEETSQERFLDEDKADFLLTDLADKFVKLEDLISTQKEVLAHIKEAKEFNDNIDPTERDFSWDGKTVYVREYLPLIDSLRKMQKELNAFQEQIRASHKKFRDIKVSEQDPLYHYWRLNQQADKENAAWSLANIWSSIFG